MRSFTSQAAVIAIVVSFVLPPAAWAQSQFSSVNNSIRLGNGTAAGDVDSVNGSIRIGADSTARSVESVNGTIDIGEGVVVEKDVEAVNGAIELDQGSRVGGSVKTVNGGIRMKGAGVAGDIETVNGGIRLLDGTVVEGNLVVREPRGWSNDRRKPVEVEIGRDVQVLGDLIFEQPVKLRIHDSARVGEVIGDEVTVIEG